MTALDGHRSGFAIDGARPRGGLVLDLDPDLGWGLAPEEWETARRACRANVVHRPPGPWDLPATGTTDRNVFALILAEGVLGQETVLAGHGSFDLLTPGDVLLPPTAGPDLVPLRPDVSLTAMSKLTVIALGPPFLRAAAQWPCLMSNLHQRLAEQQTRATIRGLVAHLPRAEHRILLTLWLLAERCARVTPEGRLLPLGFTHEALSRITAARRPTVSLALKQLQRDGLLALRADGSAILTPAAEKEIQRLAPDDGGFARGAAIALHPHATV